MRATISAASAMDSGQFAEQPPETDKPRHLPEWAVIKLNLAIHLPIRKAGMKKESLQAKQD